MGERVYIARFVQGNDEISVRIQTVSDHNFHVGRLISDNCDLPFLRIIGFLAGVLHDSGKYGSCFQDYIGKAKDNLEKAKGSSNDSLGKKVDHAFAGGWIVTDLANDKGKVAIFLFEMIRHTILCHHGLSDCIQLDNSGLNIYFDKRFQSEKFPMEEICKAVYENISREELDRLFQEGIKDIQHFLQQENQFLEGDDGKSLGNRYFYNGMCERLLMSYLIDADRTDAACFTYQRNLPVPQSDEELEALWGNLCCVLERKLSQFSRTSELDRVRSEISEKCSIASQSPERLYRLILPTGAGKTLSSLRFAVNHAKKFKKRRFFYIAPYNSILEQNAKEIREKLTEDGNADFLLEHHCNVVPEDEEKYYLSAENWDSPVVATSAVQFLDALFSSQSGCIRRMRALVNSVIVVDEVQSIPIRCQSLFNMAMNFLTEFCNTTVILCSATQPPSDMQPKNRLRTPVLMVENPDQYFKVFKRVHLHDATRAAGYTINNMTCFTMKQWNHLGDAPNALLIVNTKKAALNLFRSLKEYNGDLDVSHQFHLFHLSTNMCPAHRRSILDQVRKNLEEKKRVLCVSTQLIEAGVDISFRMVIRSLSGLDSIIQAAGRCNRNAEVPFGDVFIVNLAEDEERVSKLSDIKMGQEKTRSILNLFQTSPERFQHDLLSLQAIEEYYGLYYASRKSELDYNTGGDTTLVELLSTNTRAVCDKLKDCGKTVLFRQAFSTAGDAFKVIEEDSKKDIVVEYDEKSREEIAKLETCDLSERRRILRGLQRYTVGISELLYKELVRENVLYLQEKSGITILKKEYYSPETGVSETPSNFTTLFDSKEEML